MHSKEREQITHVCLHKAVRRQPLNIRQPGSEKGPLLVSAMGGTSVISHKGKAPWWLCTVLWSLGREREAAGICGTLVTVSLAACNLSPTAPHGQRDLCCVSILSQFLSMIKDGVSSDKQRTAG